VASHFHTFQKVRVSFAHGPTTSGETPRCRQKKHWVQSGARKEAVALAEYLTALPVR
jgi:hypothetical protein